MDGQQEDGCSSTVGKREKRSKRHTNTLALDPVAVCTSESVEQETSDDFDTDKGVFAEESDVVKRRRNEAIRVRLFRRKRKEFQMRRRHGRGECTRGVTRDTQRRVTKVTLCKLTLACCYHVKH
jgi:hypothetical protein